jgi:alkylation response protein AidB-like acyl-CoA dehydrogenase
MDFGFTDEQQEIASLARRILADKVTPDRIREIEAGTDRFDPDLWNTLATADLLGIALPEDVGGGGYGIIEQCLLLEEAGRRLAPAPLLASIVCGAAPIAAFGSAAQKEAWARPAALGRKFLTAALAESLNPDPTAPTTTAVADAEGYRLNGTKTAVLAGTFADLFVIAAATASGDVGVFLVEKDTPGLTVTRQVTTNRDAAAQVALVDVRVPSSAVLGSVDQGREILRWIVERATIGLCALQLGITEQALADTAEYTKSRVQFDRPIATFQAVGHRCADCYIDTEAVRLTLWQAAWRLSEGLPAATEVEVAKFWAAEAGHRVAHAAVHLHGGMGVANEHTIHRYFIWAKQVEFMLGGATQQLERIGATLAAEPA